MLYLMSNYLNLYWILPIMLGITFCIFITMDSYTTKTHRILCTVITALFTSASVVFIYLIISELH